MVSVADLLITDAHSLSLGQGRTSNCKLSVPGVSGIDEKTNMVISTIPVSAEAARSVAAA